MNNFNTFLYGEKFLIVKWEDNEYIIFWVKQFYKEVKCPKCNCICTKIHNRHNRKI